MTAYRIEIKFTEEALEAARRDHPASIPRRSPHDWSERELKRVVDVLSRDNDPDFEISSVRTVS
jgi:hypothetical protein